MTSTMTQASELLEHPAAIAIIGMAGRFPGARNIDEFRQNLEKGVESITFLSDQELLANGVLQEQVDKPNYVKAAPLLEGVDLFDADFFNYSAREATIMDPQHRIFLECAWQALEEAGYGGHAGNRSVGVFAGAGGVMYSYLLSDVHVNHRLIGFSGSREHIGNDKDYLSTRVSYKLNLRGPSLSVQTACSTSLVSVHLACQSLAGGECEMALAGGITVRVPQGVGYMYQEGEIFSPDGHCRPFDAQGQGTIFGSGVGIVVLKVLEDAIRDGDNILAVIRGSAINNDGGQKVSFWATVAEGQADAIAQAMAVAEIEPESIGYVEAHGTATTLGDPVEIFALKKAFQSKKRQFCAIGSVKSNVGHLDSASGVAGLIKAVLSLKHQILYPTLHFSTPNPRIDFENSPFYVNTKLKKWDAQSFPRRAAVNSLGIGGTNAHVILEEAPHQTAPADLPLERAFHLLTLSAKTAKALQALAQRYREHLREYPTQSFADVCYTANTGRAQFKHRLALVAATREEAIEQLDPFGQTTNSVQGGLVGRKRTPRIAFLFTGQGSQYVEMGRELYETESTFRQTIDRCDEILRPFMPKSLLEILYPSEPEQAALINQTAYTQPALFALEYALAQLWKSWGIQPDMVMGHSVGEYVAACVAGVFSLEDGLKMIAARGRLMQALPQDGAMMAIWGSEAQVNDLIAPYEGQVSIASVNGPLSVVISGERQAVQGIAQVLKERGLKSKELVVSHAFHSPLMVPMLDSFSKVANEVHFAPPKLDFISNVTGKVATNEVTSAEYWVNHVRQPVRFADGMQTLHDCGYEVFVEIGPKPVLLGMGRDGLPDGYGLWLPSLRPRQPAWKRMLESVAELSVYGVEINWTGFYREGARVYRRVKLPTYPFQRQRYWLTPTTRSQTQGQTPAQMPEGYLHPLLGRRMYSPLIQDICFESQIGITRTPFLADHKVLGEMVIPATGYVDMALTAAQLVFETDAITLEDLLYQAPFTLNESDINAAQLIIQESATNSASFEIVSLVGGNDAAAKDVTWQTHASGLMRPNRGPSLIGRASAVSPTTIDDIRARCPEKIDANSLYAYLYARGYHFGPAHQGIRTLWRGQNETLAELVLPHQLSAEFANYTFHPALLDACSQVILPILPDTSPQQLFITMGKERVDLYGEPTSRLWVHARAPSMPAGGTAFKGDIDIYDAQGQPVAAIRGYSMTLTSRQALARGLRADKPKDFRNLIVEVEWQKSLPKRPFIPTTLARSLWLIFADEGGVAEQFCQSLTDVRATIIKVLPGQDFEQIDPQCYTINPLVPAHFSRLLDEVMQAKYKFRANFRGVMHFWSLTERETEDLLSQQAALALGSVLQLVKALTKVTIHARFQLLLMTQGAQLISDGDTVSHPVQAAIWGLSRVMELEHPDFHVRCVDLDPAATSQPLSTRDLFRHIFVETEPLMALRQGQRFVPRLVTAKLEEEANLLMSHDKTPSQLSIVTKGSIEDLDWLPSLRIEPKPDEVEIETMAVGLNFGDILVTLGIYPDENQKLGMDCAGQVVRVGPHVTRFKVGDMVMAFAHQGGTFKEYVTIHQDMVVHLPDKLSLEEAATIPTVFLTATIALKELAQLSAGERVLIHSAAGGVGLAAIQLAQQVGAEIYATASPSKWDYLQSLGVKYVMNSRTLDYAEQIMSETNGQGVDVVLGALTDESIPLNMRILAPFGRCVDIGRNSETPLQTRLFVEEKRYYSFGLRVEASRDSAKVQSILQALCRQFEDARLKPLPQTTYSRQTMKDAFRFMQQAKHIGKMAVTLGRDGQPDKNTPPTPNIRGVQAAFGETTSPSTVLITGGLGGLGLAIGQWLASEKKMALALVGRTRANAETERAVQAMRACGAQIQLFQADVTQREALATVLATIRAEMPPLRGVVHAAGIIDDKMLVNMEWPQFSKVLAPKMSGAWNLHLLTQDLPLDFFLALSSVTALVGAVGVGNYAAANAFLDGLAHYRHSCGLPALSINWGPWADVGLLTKMSKAARTQWTERGMLPLSTEQALKILQLLLTQAKAQYGAFMVEWPLWLAHHPSKESSPLVADLAAKRKVSTRRVRRSRGQEQTTEQGSTILQKWQSASVNERSALLTTYVRQQMASVLGTTPDSIDTQKGFMELSLDSLMAVEVRNHLQKRFSISVPIALFLAHDTNAESLSQYINGQLQKTASSPEQESSPLGGTQEQVGESPIERGEPLIHAQPEIEDIMEGVL